MSTLSQSSFNGGATHFNNSPHADASCEGIASASISLVFSRTYTYTGDPTARPMFQQCFTAKIVGMTNGGASDTNAESSYSVSTTNYFSAAGFSVDSSAPSNYNISKGAADDWFVNCGAGQNTFVEYIKLKAKCYVGSEYPSGMAYSSADGTCDICPP